MIAAYGGGSVRLFHAGAEKFETKTDGVDITGNLSTDSLTVSGATALNGGLTMDTDKFTVADTTGNTSIAGTLGVSGTSTFTGDFYVKNGSTSKVVINKNTGNTAIAGTIDVDTAGSSIAAEAVSTGLGLDRFYVGVGDDTIKTADAAIMRFALGSIQANAEPNVQSDWNAGSGDAQILNKPTIPTNTNQLTNGSGFITSAMTGNSKITIKTSGNGNHTTETWCKTCIAIVIGGGGGGGNAHRCTNQGDNNSTSVGYGGKGGDGGQAFNYSGGLQGATNIPFSVGGGGAIHASGSCDDNVAHGASGQSSYFGPTSNRATAQGGGGGSGTICSVGAQGSQGSGTRFFESVYGKGGAGGVGTGWKGCQSSPGTGAAGAIWILELG